MPSELRTIKEVVREVLEESPKARNSDKLLILQCLRKMGFKIYVDYRELSAMPSWESLRRCRQVIQNEEGLYLPDEDIDELRFKKEEEMKGELLSLKNE